MRESRRAAALWLFGPAIVWLIVAGLWLGGTWLSDDAWAEVPSGARKSAAPVGSDVCASCHPVQHQSWHQSYHRTMTQRADSEGAVLAPFAGETLDFLGFRATMDRDTQGRPRVEVRRLQPSGEQGAPVLASRVQLTVGSHHYQQYVGIVEGEELSTLLDANSMPTLHRLPVAWHIGEQRWIHMNAAFVEPDGQDGQESDYLRHVTRWNDNCIFCHNTEPAPGRAGGGWQSSVAEVGIACEACHGKAELHVVRHQDPARRLLAAAVETPDFTIADPRRQAPLEESSICGRCHGQRLGRDIDGILEHGDGFVPGTDLSTVSRPIFRDTRIGGRGEPVFESRFWPDGTPRLSAYEYQGLLLSPCYDEGGPRGLGCNHCHDMHGDEPSMQLRPERRGEGACLSCHAKSELAGGADHGGHADAGEGRVDCLSCHMPRITYGLLEGMVSHRIASPDPGAWVGRDDKPDACTSCHTERSREWAARSMAELDLHGTPFPNDAKRVPESSQVAVDLVGGDALQRNLAAHALAQEHATGDWEQRAGWLVYALDDEYPSVRWFAWRGLRAVVEQSDASASRATALRQLAEFDYTAAPELRAPVTAALARRFPALPLEDAPALRETLEESRSDKVIWIGE